MDHQSTMDTEASEEESSTDEEPMEVSEDEEDMDLDDSEDPTANISFQEPQPIEEPSLQDAVPNERSDIVEGDCEVEYTESGSQKGRLKLADSNGYTYTVKKRRKNSQIDWTCSVRNKALWCKASVKQNGMSFVRGPQPQWKSWSQDSHRDQGRNKEDSSKRSLHIIKPNCQEGGNRESCAWTTNGGITQPG